MHICTTSPKINRLFPPRDLERRGGSTNIHETMPMVDDLTVRGSSLSHHKTQSSTSNKTCPIHAISYLPNYTIEQTQKTECNINH
jgi:hypothetical protein